MRRTRSLVAAGWACALLCSKPAGSVAREVRQPPCPIDTAELENAIQADAPLAVLDGRISADLGRLRSLYSGDIRRHVSTIQARWLCELGRRCGAGASPKAFAPACLHAGLTQRLHDLDESIREAGQSN